MNKLLLVAAALAGLGLTAGTASADGWGRTPYCQGTGHCGGYGTWLQPYPAPVVQAAPWYLYFPYNAHFMTPGPIAAPFFAPPYAGGTMVNPYFPAPVYLNPQPLPPSPAPAYLNPQPIPPAPTP